MKSKTAFEKERGIPMPEKTYTTAVEEQCSDAPSVEIRVDILSEDGKIWIRPEGYGDTCSLDGEGWPVGMEIWEGRLRLIVFEDINTEEPRFIDLEKAKESCRLNDR
jgi:hypothetical protein